ncbi:PPC domain-containing DNA-binding protein [Mucilaginibacter lacusdianchii]|uniref:PPC domain-containing DNA-binding protein n=1 Tax=Mucilaginibacter lacusdianchii TaxID=2684211 RepID=UPI00131DA933|nr:PPC domain-containing DNA-binding protein [Mucilaginibacter sp. JXJ CY 39]
MRKIFKYATALIIGCFIAGVAYAQEYVSPTNPAQTGKSPGVKAQLLSQNGNVKTYILVFAKEDEIMSGLTEFAQKNNITSAHFTAIGDALRARVGWYDQSRKMFKVIPITEPAEITSLIGDIAMYNGKPVVHAHINLATSDGMVHGGHLLEAYIFPTLEVRLTVEPEAMYKKLYLEAGATIIDAGAKP